MAEKTDRYVIWNHPSGEYRVVMVVDDEAGDGYMFTEQKYLRIFPEFSYESDKIVFSERDAWLYLVGHMKSFGLSFAKKLLYMRGPKRAARLAVKSLCSAVDREPTPKRYDHATLVNNVKRHLDERAYNEQ